MRVQLKVGETCQPNDEPLSAAMEGGANVSKRALLILTEVSTYELCRKEAATGRVPINIEFFRL
jgi:hypothetical protein